MGYATNQDILDAVGQDTVRRLTDDQGSGVIDTSVLAGEIDDAHEVVNAYVRGRYELPFDETPRLLTMIETALVVERLYRRRPSAETPESVSDAAEKAMRKLRRLSEGKLTLGLDSEGDGEEDGADSYRTTRTSEKETIRDKLQQF
jgi:phage gp36-like protein